MKKFLFMLVLLAGVSVFAEPFVKTFEIPQVYTKDTFDGKPVYDIKSDIPVNGIVLKNCSKDVNVYVKVWISDAGKTRNTAVLPFFGKAKLTNLEDSVIKNHIEKVLKSNKMSKSATLSAKVQLVSTDFEMSDVDVSVTHKNDIEISFKGGIPETILNLFDK